MDNRKLSYFLKVCEMGSIAKASESLFISQQALSKAIESLEQELGVPLFFRSAKGLTLTRYGKVVQSEAWHLEKHQERMLRRISSMVLDRESSVSLSFYSGMIKQFPDGFFEQFMARYPDVRFHFFSYADDAHGRRFANTDADLFFATMPITGTDLRLTYEFHVPLCLLAAKGHPLAQKGFATLEDLRNEQVLFINSDLESNNRLLRLFESNGIGVHSILSDAEQEFSYFLVRHRGALVFYAGPKALQPDGTVRIPIHDYPMTWSCYIYERAEGIPQAAQALLSEVIAYRQAHQQEALSLFS